MCGAAFPRPPQRIDKVEGQLQDAQHNFKKVADMNNQYREKIRTMTRDYAKLQQEQEDRTNGLLAEIAKLEHLRKTEVAGKDDEMRDKQHRHALEVKMLVKQIQNARTGGGAPVTRVARKLEQDLLGGGDGRDPRLAGRVDDDDDDEGLHATDVDDDVRGDPLGDDDDDDAAHGGPHQSGFAEDVENMPGRDDFVKQLPKKVAGASPVRSPAKRYWSSREKVNVVKGVMKYGWGKWKRILDDPAYHFNNRSAMNLKDCVRACPRPSHRHTGCPRNPPLRQARTVLKTVYDDDLNALLSDSTAARLLRRLGESSRGNAGQTAGLDIDDIDA